MTANDGNSERRRQQTTTTANDDNSKGRQHRLQHSVQVSRGGGCTIRLFANVELTIHNFDITHRNNRIRHSIYHPTDGSFASIPQPSPPTNQQPPTNTNQHQPTCASSVPPSTFVGCPQLRLAPQLIIVRTATSQCMEPYMVSCGVKRDLT